MKRWSLFATLCCAFVLVTPALAKVKVTRSVFQFNDEERVYYWFAPDAPGPLPLVVLLHGSGRDGDVMAEAWKDLAAREKFMIAAPDASDKALWDSSRDTPLFLHTVVDQMRAVHAVDDSRIYLFGHSAGAVYALALALIDSEYYAAVAVHAGDLHPENYGLFQQATRQMPVGIWVGSRDLNFPVEDVMETKRAFDAHGFKLEVHVLQGETHNYDNFSEEIDNKAWSFLKDKRLSLPNP